jgi:hypothetical protein
MLKQQGMPRILLSTAHIAPLILQSIGVIHTMPDEVATYPPLPQPFHATAARCDRLRTVDANIGFDAEIATGLESSKKVFAVPDSLGEVVADFRAKL